MRPQFIFKTAAEGLSMNRMRTLLTVLGIVIGVTAIIMIQSIGQGAQALILNEIRGLGSQTVTIHPGREPKSPSDFTSLYSDSLKERDLKAITEKTNVPDLKDAAPLVVAPATMVYEGTTKSATVIGSTRVFADILNIDAAQGDMLSTEDVNAHASVIVIGSKIKTDLFGASDAVGEQIKVKNKMFRVIGVFPAKGDFGFFNLDEAALVPYTTAQDYLLGTNYFHEIVVRASTEQNANNVKRDIERTLMDLHNISDPDKADFYVSTQSDLMTRVSSVTGVLTALLASVAAISLVVGGVGIMNIMLVSVTERTREIGLRKALGATERDILQQFLVESVLLTGAGGLIGVVLGGVLSFLVSVILARFVSSAWPFVFSIPAAVVGLVVSAAVGFIFGLYPARQAAEKDPIEALRYE